MTTTQSTDIHIGDTVTFKPEAGGTRVGLTYVVDAMNGKTDKQNGNKEMVGIKRRVGGRWGYRLAYRADLVKV